MSILNRDEAPLTDRQRAYIYRVTLALLPLLVFYGLVSEAEAAEWALVVAAVLGVGDAALATANTSTDR